MSALTVEVTTTALVQGPRGELDGLNLVGLKRRGMDRAEIQALRAAYEVLAKGEGTFLDRVRLLAETTASAQVREMAAFVLGGSDRSFLTPK